VREQRGSVLVLMPAAVLVLLVLGALCVDHGSVYAATRELNDAAAAAANDAAVEALDVDRFYANGEVGLLEDRAWVVARRSVAAKGLDRLDAVVTDVRVDPSGKGVTVTVRGRARYLFAKAVPGGSDGIDVEASSSADAAER
jgi:Flp pilus assembly protein TadG